MFLRVVVLLLLFADLTLTASPPRAGAQTERTLRIGMTQEPGTLDPIVGTLAVETDVDQLIFSGLTRFDEHGNHVPDLAEAVPTRANGGISPDGRIITYHLVHNAQWQDGVPVTSADVKFTYDAIMNPNNNVVGRVLYEEIARIETPDPYTVRLVLKRPWAPVLDAFSDANQGAIVPAHLLAKYDNVNHVDFNSAPVGSGPYKLVEWRRGSEMIFEANPNFYRGAPKIKRVRLRFLTNDNTMTIALQSHELDEGDKLNISTYANLGNVSGMLPALTTQTWWEHLTFNHGRAPTNDPRVRLALCYGFDVHEIYAKVAHGLGMLGPGSENPATPWYNQKLRYYPFDPRRASELLDAAGWRMGPDGVRLKDGKRLTLTIMSTSGNISREQTEVILQQRWRAIGVELIIKNSPAATVFALAQNGGPLYSGNYDIALSAFIQNIPDPQRLNFNTKLGLPPSGNNIAFYRSKEMDGLEDQAAGMFDFAKRKPLYDKIQELEVRDLPYYTIRWEASKNMRAVDLAGFRPVIVASNFWNIADWYFTD